MLMAHIPASLPAVPERDQFALTQALLALHAVISSWRRRGHSLLLVGCGAGLALEIFWDAGFDVTGVEQDQALLNRARARLGVRADLLLGNLSHLPFDDNQFDYAVVADLPGLEVCPTPFVERALEAARCAGRGVAFGFFNRASFYGLGQSRKPERQQRQRPAPLQWGALRRTLREAGFEGRAATVSTLLGPASSWKKNRLGQVLNGRMSRFSLGAYTAGRLDFGPPATITPLLLPAKKQNKAAQATAGPIRSTAPRNAADRESA